MASFLFFAPLIETLISAYSYSFKYIKIILPLFRAFAIVNKLLLLIAL